MLCQGKPADDIDFEALAKKTEDFSGADLKAVVDVAIEAKLREAMKAGMPKPLHDRRTPGHPRSQGALGTVRPSTSEWFATARNYALYANQGGAYDDVLEYLKLNKA